MPESLNLPFKMCMTKEPERPYQLMKDVEELKDIFKKAGVDLSKLFIASCGTGKDIHLFIYLSTLFNEGKHI